MNSSLYDLIERLGNLLRAEVRQSGSVAGLQPVHFQALHYLSCCNRYSNTPAGVSDYLGVTKGTVSQTLLVLEKKGYIAKRPDERDRRVVHLELTSEGRALVDQAVPPEVFKEALGTLPGEEAAGLEAGLTELLRAMQHSRGLRSFGVCQSCRFFRSEPGGYRCGLTREPLSPNDSTRICREHEHEFAETNNGESI